MIILNDLGELVLTNLPMPPTANRFLIPCWRQRRLIKSPEMREFSAKVDTYIMDHQIKAVKALNKMLTFDDSFENQDFLQAKKEDNGEPKLGYKVNCFFLFPEEKLFAKTKAIKGKPKRLDADNRVKAIRDAVAKIIGVDDSYFYSGNCEKVISSTGKESVMVVISPTKIRHESRIKKYYEMESAK